MRTKTFRGLAAGAGAAAVLVGGASAAAGAPDSAAWEEQFAQESGRSDVTCLVSQVNGAPGVLSLAVEDDTWAPLLAAGNEWVGLAIDVDSEFDVQDWQGYTTYEYGADASGGANIDNAVICQAPVAGAAPAADEEEAAEADTPSGPPVASDEDAAEEPAADEAAEDEAAADDEAAEDEAAADDDAAQDEEATDDDAPTGPPVETDGPATPAGPNMGLMGGAALLLGGAGAAGWAVRRRAGEH